jgi:hypothetical protein
LEGGVGGILRFAFFVDQRLGVEERLQDQQETRLQ